MRWLFHRSRFAPFLVVFGMGGILNDDWTAGLTVIGSGFVYWWIGGLLERKSRLAQGKPVSTVRAIEQVAPSDGFGGAFSRLDPRIQAWLRDELAARASHESIRR